MRVAAIIIMLLFALFAGVQLNDPDPLPWIVAYGFVAVVAGLYAFGRPSRGIVLVGLVVLLLVLGYRLPGFLEWIRSGAPTLWEDMQADKPYVEAAREFLGLSMAFVALLFFYLTHNLLSRDQ